MIAIGAARVVPNELDVAAQWNDGQHVLGFSAAEARQLRPEADRKALHADAEIFCDQKMPELMDDNEQAERHRDLQDDFHHLQIFHTRLPLDYRGPGNTGGAMTSTPGGT